MSLQRVIFDSSFLLAVVENPTTWFEDITEGLGRFQPILLDCTRSELEKMAGARNRRARVARVSLDLASEFAGAPCGGANVDDEIVSAALSTKAVVATIDSKLARALKAAHVGVVSLRSGRVALS